MSNNLEAKICVLGAQGEYVASRYVLAIIELIWARCREDFIASSLRERKL